MSFMQWTEDLSVKIESVDAQHKRLLTIINNLYDAMQVGKANDVMRKILADLATYTHEHFSYEERLFSQHAYPGAAGHQKSHAILIDQLKELQDQLQRRQLVSIKTFSFLKKWLTEHIMKEDRQYAEFLRGKGVR